MNPGKVISLDEAIKLCPTISIPTKELFEVMRDFEDIPYKYAKPLVEKFNNIIQEQISATINKLNEETTSNGNQQEIPDA